MEAERREEAPRLDVVARLREYRKLMVAVAAGFLASGLLVLLALGAVTGSLTGGAALAIAVAAVTLFIALIFMDVLWEGWGVQLFTAITVVVVTLLLLNMIFGRQVMP
jgi:uncharacterized membrane protein YjjP (DUF1212 family)